MAASRERLASRRELLLKGAAAGAFLWTRRGRLRTQRPNLLVITSDQQHWQAVGFEDPFFETPACDQLASTSAIFRRAFCTSPQCSPSRSSMMSGFYPHRSGVKNNHGMPGDEGLQVPTIGLHLQRAGYHTAYHGKWHLGKSGVGRQGWDVFRPTTKPADAAVARRACRFLRRASDLGRPFALFAMFLEPHGIQGFEPSEKQKTDIEGVELDRSWREEDFEGKPAVQREFLERTGVGRRVGREPRAWREYHAAYRERVRSFDRQVEAVLGALRDSGLEDDTVVVLTSDHGDMDTHHRLIFKGPFMYEHLVRVPTLVRVPSAWGGAHRDLEHFAWVHVDLVPTLLELAGADAIECDGRSMAPLLRGEPLEPRRYVIGQFHGKGRWIHPIRMLRTPDHKYNRDLVGGEELYDLREDPLELRNLAGTPEHAELRARLASDLDAWMRRHGDPFPSFDPKTGEVRR